jgi:hypothetical protein
MRYDTWRTTLLGEQRLITYKEPADILTVPDNVVIVSPRCYWMVALVIFFLLVETIKNRNHQC